MRKLSSKWAPRLLTVDHKQARVVAFEQCLGMFQRNSKEFSRSYVTVNETWIHYYTPETKNQSKMWTRPGDTCFFSWFCFINEKLNSTGCKKISNQRTDLYRWAITISKQMMTLGNMGYVNEM